MTDVSRNRPADPAVEAAARGRVVGKRDRRTKVEKRARARQQARAPPLGAEVCAYSIPEFCRVHGGISQSYFHALVAKGKGPRLMKIGARTLISVEAAAEWRKQQEATTEQVH
jgi:hypothetical protein